MVGKTLRMENELKEFKKKNPDAKVLIVDKKTLNRKVEGQHFDLVCPHYLLYGGTR